MKKSRFMKRLLWATLVLVLLVPLAVITVQVVRDPDSDAGSEPRSEAGSEAGSTLSRDLRSEQMSSPVAHSAEQIQRGAYLARAGNCMGCHTVRGGAAYAGARAIATPFGSIYSSNITPDAETGIGSWTGQDFWRALHNGKSRDGHFLYPAFPYTSYTKVSRADADALFVYFKTIAPIRQLNKEHELRFPFNQRILLAFWRTLYFTPGEYKAEAKQSPQWNRGAYLVQGLGHCAACHTARNALGGTTVEGDLAGGLIPVLGWYASSLTADPASGLGKWDMKDIADLLKTGVSQRGAVYGPMAEVVKGSLQHLSHSDIEAMATYLKAGAMTANSSTMPHAALASAQVSAQASVQASAMQAAMLQQGAKLYEKHCEGCHQADGKGLPPAYPPLAGKQSAAHPSTLTPAGNQIRLVLNGGYPPSTAGNPRPYGMPAFGPMLNDDEVAAVVSYIRASWNNKGALVSPLAVSRLRGVPVD